jgi:tetratricopeptide (TPR) repeat protein
MTLLTLCYEDSDDNWRLNFRRALRRLLSLSLIQSSHDQFTLFLDKSTQIHIYQEMESNGILGMWQQKAVEVLAKIFPDSNTTYWPQCETLLPHVLTVLTYIPADNDSKISRAILLCKLGKYNKALGDNDNALDRKSQALEIYQAIYGENALETLEVEKEIANILYRQQKLVESEAKLIRVLGRYKASLPENHYLILTHYNSLNAVVQDLGKFEQAEEYAQKALQGYQQI